MLVGLVLGGMDDAAEVEGRLEGMEVGWTDALGDSTGIDEGTPVLVGLVLGWLDG